MATAPNLPMLYNELEALNSAQHGKLKIKTGGPTPAMGQAHAVPVTVDEFIMLQRYYPIVFSSGDNPVPLALMGLNEGINTFIKADGQPVDDRVFLPAYMRRYPFLLARLNPDSDELSLCFDPTAETIGEFEDGEPLFDGDEPSQVTQQILAFCETFETAGQRTQAFMAELEKSGLLMEGEVSIQPEGSEQPFIYRGFQMVDEAKFRELTGDKLRKMQQNGMLPLILAHLFSLSLVSEIFGRQAMQGRGPVAAPETADA